MRAQKAQSKAARVNFDWTELRDVLAKVEEELGEQNRPSRHKIDNHAKMKSAICFLRWLILRANANSTPRARCKQPRTNSWRVLIGWKTNFERAANGWEMSILPSWMKFGMRSKK